MLSKVESSRETRHRNVNKRHAPGVTTLFAPSRSNTKIRPITALVTQQHCHASRVFLVFFLLPGRQGSQLTSDDKQRWQPPHSHINAIIGWHGKEGLETFEVARAGYLGLDMLILMTLESLFEGQTLVKMNLCSIFHQQFESCDSVGVGEFVAFQRNSGFILTTDQSE